MGNTEMENKLVSIIIPVYNAEKYLGYCLNSVTSQTYREIEVILVNDGSTDGSLEICRNYAAIDRRIKVITVPNGGVSNARNRGLDAAEGEYIQFVDSDDVIRPDMVENMVQLMETYETDMAVCGFKMVTLGETPADVDTFAFTSNIMGKECVLTREMFFSRMAFILWRTTYLESSWNKMFRRSIIRDHHLQFPQDISLGEDFCFNMEYFRYVKGIVFTNDCYYYYLQDNPEALTRKYRPDLFENQMFLIQKFHGLLSSETELSKVEETELAEYTVSKMMQSLDALTGPLCPLTISEKKRKIAKIINNEYVRHAWGKAKYIEPKHKWIRECMEFSDVQKIVGFLFNPPAPLPDTPPEKVPSTDNRNIAPTEQQPIYRKPWWLKQFLINICNVILKIHHIQFIEQIRNSLQVRSIKKTVKKSLLKLIGKSQEYDKIGIL